MQKFDRCQNLWLGWPVSYFFMWNSVWKHVEKIIVNGEFYYIYEEYKDHAFSHTFRSCSLERFCICNKRTWTRELYLSKNIYVLYLCSCLCFTLGSRNHRLLLSWSKMAMVFFMFIPTKQSTVNVFTPFNEGCPLGSRSANFPGINALTNKLYYSHIRSIYIYIYIHIHTPITLYHICCVNAPQALATCYSFNGKPS